MSTSRIAGWLAAVAVVGGAVAISAYTWEGWDGRRPAVSGPRLVAEGTTGGARWSVVQVRERQYGDCLYLRQDGALLERSCAPSGVLLRHNVSVRTLRGGGPIVFGVLPEGSARAEVAADGGDTAVRFRKAELVPLEVRGWGSDGRFVAQAAPPGPEWRDRNAAVVDVFDEAGGRITR